MNQQYLYIGLGIAIVVMVIGIAWMVLTSQGKKVSVTVAPAPGHSTPILPASNEQLIRNHIDPVFRDMVDKEQSKALTERLYSAYKSPEPVTGISSTVKGG